MDGLKLTLRPRSGVAGGEMVFAGDKMHSMTFVEGLSGQPIRIDGAFQEAEDFVDQARMDITDPQPGPLRDLAWPHGLPFVLETPQPYYIWAQVGMDAYKFPLLMGNETTGGLTDAPATLQIGGRLVHGIVLFAAYKDECVGDRRTLEVLIGPWIALFGYSRRRRVWKGTAADILETLVQEYGDAYGGAPTTHCNLKDLSRRDFTVQMDESDLVFLMRVLERDNIFLNFRHDAQGTHITLCQDNDDAKLEVLDGRPMRLSYNRDDIVELMDDVVTDVGMRSRLVPSQYMMRDYNPQNAAARLVAQYPADKGVHQVYDYPGGFQKLTSGVDTMAKRRMSAFAHQKWFLRVESICPDMMPGAVLSLPLEGAERLPGIGPGDRFMVCLVRHELRRRRPDGAGIYRNVFEALRTWLIARGFGYRQLFWITGGLAFFISPVADNLTTALLMCAVVLAVAGGNGRFVLLAAINIVVAANAGGAFSPFGDITTLMVWQKNVQTAQGGVDTAVKAMRAGANDFVIKPPNPERLRVSIGNALKVGALTGQLDRLSRKMTGELGFTDLIAVSPAMMKVMDLARRGGASSIPILIEGESGVGKELIARAIQGTGERAGKAFVTVNCGAIPDNLVESILFGHEKGAFTGAVDKHVGKFQEANGGTLFLDEIGELKPDIQVKLLRALQESEIDPIGASRPVKVDIRLISATNRNLMEQVAQGNFREDLFYRLNVFPIHVPPLRERREDIPPLVEHFTASFAVAERKTVTGIADEAMRLLAAFDWPGNVRQLENTIFRAVVLCDGPVLQAADFPQIVQSAGTMPAAASPPRKASTKAPNSEYEM